MFSVCDESLSFGSRRVGAAPVGTGSSMASMCLSLVARKKYSPLSISFLFTSPFVLLVAFVWFAMPFDVGLGAALEFCDVTLCPVDVCRGGSGATGRRAMNVIELLLAEVGFRKTSLTCLMPRSSHVAAML